MIVAVWDHTKTKMGATFSSAYGVVVAYMYRCKVVLSENCVHGKSIGDVLLDRNYSQELKNGSFFHTCRSPGEGLATWVGQRYLKQYINDYVEVMERSLYFEPQHIDMNEEPYDLKMYHEIDDILYAAERFADHIIINTESHTNLTSNILLAEADTIVVLMEDSPIQFQYFIQKYKSVKHKCIFVIVKPDYQLFYQIRNLILQHGIESDRIWPINYTEKFLYYVNEGRLLEYIQYYYQCSKTSSEYNFINQLKKCTNLIFGNQSRESGVCEQYGNYWLMKKINYRNIPKKHHTRTDDSDFY